MPTWQSILTMLVGGAFSAGGAVAFAIIRKKAVKWTKVIDNPVVKDLNKQLDLWLDDTINIVNQDFVDKLKKIGEWEAVSGIFNKSTYEKNKTQAQELGLITLKSILPRAFKKLVSRYYDDTDSFYKKRLDQRLKERKLLKQESMDKQKIKPQYNQGVLQSSNQIYQKGTVNNYEY